MKSHIKKRNKKRKREEKKNKKNKKREEKKNKIYFQKKIHKTRYSNML